MKAYCLVNCELGSEDQVAKTLSKFEVIRSITPTFGAYDLVIELETKTSSEMSKFITWKIRKIEKVRSTTTLQVLAVPNEVDKS